MPDEVLQIIAFVLLVSYFTYHVFFEPDIAYGDCYIVEPIGRYRCRIHDVRTGKSFTMRFSSSRWETTTETAVKENLYEVRTNYKLRMILEKHYPDIYKRYLCTLTEMPE